LLVRPILTAAGTVRDRFEEAIKQPCLAAARAATPYPANDRLAALGRERGARAFSDSGRRQGRGLLHDNPIEGRLHEIGHRLYRQPEMEEDVLRVIDWHDPYIQH
jgi:hypothetical protein